MKNLLKTLSIFALLLVAVTPDILIAQPTLCTVSGVIYLPDGSSPAVGVNVIVRDVRDVNNIPILLGPAYYTTDDTGFVSFTVPRQATCKIEAPVACLNTRGGVSITIPNSATATLTSIAVTSCTGVTASTTTGLTVQENDVSVSSNKFNTLDFSTEFSITESPTAEANISLSGTQTQSDANYWIADGDTATIDMRTALHSFSLNVNGTRKASIDSTGKLYTAYGVVNLSAASLVFGSVTATSHVFTTDGTGDGEVSLPAQSIGATEIENTAVTAASYGSATQVATFTVDADGRLTAAANTTISYGTETKGFTLENPTSSEDLGLPITFPYAVTIDSVRAWVQGSSTPSVTVQFPHGTNMSSMSDNLFASGQAITSTTSGHRLSSFSDNTLAAAEVMRLTTSAQSGTVTALIVVFYYRRT